MTALASERSRIPVPGEGARDEPSQTALSQIPNVARANDTLRGVLKTLASATRTKSGSSGGGSRIAERETSMKDADESSKARCS